MKRVAIFATHPIQYHAPLFRSLALQKDLRLAVFYAMLPAPADQGVGFGTSFRWDIDLLEGYDYSVLSSRRTQPNLRSFWGNSSGDFYRFLGTQKFDVALITGWHSLYLLQALRACRIRKIPVLVRGESNDMRKRPFRARLFHRVLLSQYSAFLAIGKSNREFYLKNHVPPARIFHSPYFVDNARFEIQSEQALRRRFQLREQWTVPQDAYCFVFAGKLQEKKRILDLLGGFRIAFSRNQKLHLLIVGTGELLGLAKEFCSSHVLPVTFCGFLNQTEITDAYAAADCLVLPSDYGETWGLVVNEAMACGLPAVVSDRVGCGPDLVEPAVTGFHFPFGDTNALAERLVVIATDLQHSRQMGERARQLVNGNYSVDRALEGIMAALEFVTANRPKTPVTP